MKKMHFVGIGGNGMSALAQIHAMSGDRVSGSDRLLDKAVSNMPMWEKFKALNIGLFPQNGKGIAPDTDSVILSSAIEPGNPDWEKAKKLNIPITHRSELLARHVSSFNTIAVSGTSGKSTTVAMIYEILEGAARSPSVITGGHLVSLQEKGWIGNVFRGTSNLLVIEADESDGSLVNYHPAMGLMLNLTKDHKDMDTLRSYFRKFKGNCQRFMVNADEDNLAEFAAGASTFGIQKGDFRAQNIELGPASSSFSVQSTKFNIPLCGLHNVQNAVAAIAACVEMGLTLDECVLGLARFKGVARRFASIGVANGVEVIDDFAHNPAKISAAISAAHLRGKRVLVFYQPHGYAPVKLLKQELIDAFSKMLCEEDILWMPDIYYIGGTVDKSVSSGQLIDGIAARGRKAFYIPSRDEITSAVARSAKPGDVVLVMGARDPTITDYARSVLKAIGSVKPA